MGSRLEEFKRGSDYLICIDSDGCAMDTMDIKHYRCFGPCMVAEWGLEKWQDALLARWNDINLYTGTRGINRYKALGIILQEIDRDYCPIPGLRALENWIAATGELSNKSLEDAIAAAKAAGSSAEGGGNPEGAAGNPAESDGTEAMKKALSWSVHVNEGITALSEDEKKAFPGLKEALASLKGRADLVVVSSANLQAVMDEWKKEGILEYMNLVLTQNDGSKAFCIQELLKKGYDENRVLMVGDAPGDYDAAAKNNVCFFPILVRKEEQSWRKLREEAADRFFSGSYRGEYEEAQIESFRDNLR